MNIFGYADISFWVFFLFFLVGCFFSFFLPGYYFISRIRVFSETGTAILSFIFGFVLFAFQGYFFGYLHIRWMTYLYILFFAYASYQHKEKFKHFFIEIKNQIKKVDHITFSLIFIGIVIQTIPVVGSGMSFADGARFFGVNAYDGVMHLAYIQSIINYFPPQEPGAAGNAITNYHYWSDLVFAELVRIWQLPIPHLFFQYAPLFISFLTLSVGYYLVRVMGGSKRMGWFFLFFLIFGGDVPFLFTLPLYQSFGFSIPAIDNGATQFLNMPHAVAKMVFLGGLLTFIRSMKQGKGLLVITVILFASLFGFKIYFGLYIAIGFLFLCIYYLITSLKKASLQDNLLRWYRNQKQFLLAFVTLVVVALLIYLPSNSNSGGLFYAPLEWPKLLLGSGGIDMKQWWYLVGLANSTQNVLLSALTSIIAIVITLICVYGTRIIGIVPNRKILHVFGKQICIFLFVPLFIFQLLGLFTLQQSGIFNVYNFFSVSAVILCLFAASTLSSMDITKKTALLLFLLFLTTIPRVFYETYFYLRNYTLQKDVSLVLNDELEAFSYIKRQPDKNALVQAHPNNHLDRNTPYVSFFTNRLSYLSAVTLQQTHNQPIEKRKKELDDIFKAPNSGDLASKLRQHHITYLYLQKTPEQSFPFELTHGHFEYVFENKSVLVLKPR